MRTNSKSKLKAVNYEGLLMATLLQLMYFSWVVAIFSAVVYFNGYENFLNNGKMWTSMLPVLFGLSFVFPAIFPGLTASFLYGENYTRKNFNFVGVFSFLMLFGIVLSLTFLSLHRWL